MKDINSFKNALFHIFTLFGLVTLGRIVYDYKTVYYDPYNNAKLKHLSIPETVFTSRFQDSIFVDIFSIIFIFLILSLLVARYNKTNRLLNESLVKGQDELELKEKFLSGYIKALNSSTILTSTDSKGVITYVNKQFIKLSGYSKEELIGKTHSIIKHPETLESVYYEMWRTIQSKQVWSGMIKGLRKDQTTFINNIFITPILDKDENIVEYLTTRTDITSLVESKEKLEKSFVTDKLTNLPNRNQLLSDIKVIDHEESANLALLNIDSFKDLNDFYGYEVADSILLQVALSLQKLVFSRNLHVYKLPSDEFAIFDKECLSGADFIENVKSIVLQLVEMKFETLNQSIGINFSVGITVESDGILTKADMALHNAKKNNKDFVVYTQELNTESKISDNIKKVTLLKNSLNNDQIVPYFQPIYNLKSKKIEKYECLARIVDDRGFVIPPLHFLNVAIKSKLYPQLTRMIVTKSFEFFKDKEYEFSINISMEDIKTHEVVEFIIDSLKTFHNPSRVVFEILETEEIQNYDVMKKFIQKVKEYGCKIAIDDFGSGYSNFVHILELQVDYLKIDASLVKNITHCKQSEIITKTIIDFANALDMKTIAEFVEDQKSLEMLEIMGANYIQGYYIGKPRAHLIENPII